jgi:hypothetical protein
MIVHDIYTTKRSYKDCFHGKTALWKGFGVYIIVTSGLSIAIPYLDLGSPKMTTGSVHHSDGGRIN